MKRTLRTRAQARAFVRKHGICGIFSENGGRMPCLWDAADFPERQPGEKGWGSRVIAVWTWKDELPALYPDEIFYGKIPGGLAVLMSLEYFWREHYPKHHVPLAGCSRLARTIHELIAFEPMTTAQLRKALGMAKGASKNQFEKALLELQVTLNLARRNSLEDRHDTWVRFEEQYSPPAKR